MSFSKGYVLQEAQEMMTLSAIAYAGEGDGNYGLIQSAIEQALAASPVLAGNYQLVWLGISSDYANLMYVVRDRRAQARFAVAIRGTDWNFFTDWKEDFYILSTHDWPTARPQNPAIQVSTGAWDALQVLLGLTSNVFNMTPPGIVSPMPVINLFMSEALLNSYDTDVDVMVTGHSLGGAMASAFGLWLEDTASQWVLRPNRVNLKSYTFAAPTAGNQAFADYYDAQSNNPQVGWQAYRVYNQQDVVPYGWSNLNGIIGCGIPMTFEFALELGLLIATIETTMTQYGVSYAQLGSLSGGTARPLSNNPPNANCPPVSGADCSLPTFPPQAKDMTTLGCWVTYEHDHNTYLCLLGAPAVITIGKAFSGVSFPAAGKTSGAVAAG